MAINAEGSGIPRPSNTKHHVSSAGMEYGTVLIQFIMAVGNHLAPSVPVENALYYNECYLEMRDRY